MLNGHIRRRGWRWSWPIEMLSPDMFDKLITITTAPVNTARAATEICMTMPPFKKWNGSKTM